MTPETTGLDLSGATLSAVERDRLAAALAAVGVTVAGTLRASLIPGGRSNLTYRLTDGVSFWVLRTPPRVGRTPSAHDVAREFWVTSALANTDVPVARPVVLVEDDSVLGVPLTIVDYVEGVSLRTQEDLDRLDQTALDTMVTRLMEALAALHRVDYVVAGLERFGRPDGYAERQLRRWSGQWNLVGSPEIARAGRKLAAALAAKLPTRQERVGVVHGDYRLDNTLMCCLSRSSGQFCRGPHLEPTVAAIVDWELSTIGDPVSDVAMMCAYRNSVFDLILGTPGSWTSTRLPAVDALAGQYVAAGGVPLVDWDFHLGLAYFKIGVIAAGIDHRYRAGATSGPGFATSGEAVVQYFELASTALRARS